MGKEVTGREISSNTEQMFKQQENAFQTWDPNCKKKVYSGLQFEKNPRWEKIMLCGKYTTGRPK